MQVKQYCSYLLRGALPLVILLAVVNLINSLEWRVCANYFLISNYLLLYPVNELFRGKRPAQALSRGRAHGAAFAPEGGLELGDGDRGSADGLRRRRRHQAEEPRQTPGHARRPEASQATQQLTTVFLFLAENAALLIVAPVFFLTNLLAKGALFEEK